MNSWNWCLTQHTLSFELFFFFTYFVIFSKLTENTVN
jgi:hypothetical protein